MRNRVVITTLPVLLLVWGAIGGYLAQRHEGSLAEAEQNSRNLAHAFEENIRRTVEAIDTTIRAARVARAHDPDHFDLAAWERDSGLTRELTLQLSVSDRNGAVVLSNLNAAAGQRLSIADREHFRVPRDQAGDSLFISRPVIGRVSGRWSVQFVRRLVDAGGAFDGVLVASLDPAFLSRFFASLNVGDGALLLLGQDGIVRSAAPATVAQLGGDLSETRLISGVAGAAHGTVRMTGPQDKIERIYSWRRIDAYGLTVVVGLSTADALGSYQRDLVSCAVIGLLLTLATPLVSSVLARHRRDVVRSREILRAAVENISQGLLVVDGARQVRVLNARAVELLGLPPHLQHPGIKFDDLLAWQLEAGEFAGQNAESVLALVRSGGLEQGSSMYHRTRRDGTVLEIRTKVLETGLAVRTFTDITEQEHNAQVLADARDAAETAARVRSEFLAVMSHEIRTPLNGVIGVAALLDDMELGETQREYVRLIRQSGDHLLDLINDILDFSRLEAEGVQLEAVEFDPAALLREVTGMFLTQAATKGLQLLATAADGMPAAVTGDPGRLRQVLVNLIGNAIKFTDQGWVSLTMTHEPDGDGYVKLAASVADSGIGIPSHAVERIFEEFTQMDGSISRRFGGSGLGLPICRRLIELMGGSIAVDSRLGVGSTFRFDVRLKLAVRAAPAKVAMPAEPQAEPCLHILVAEDNPTNRLVALRILERLGHDADAVENGAEAVAALTLAHYDLILMDVMMPEMDGLAATRKIRATESPGEGIAIVGLTAGSSAESLAACLDAGMNAVTTKPVTPARLREAIAEGLAARGVPVAGAGAAPATSRMRELAEMLGDEAAAEILQTFAQDTTALLQTMRQAAATDDRPAIYRCAHSFAGAARNVGADALAQRASELEQTVGSLTAERIAAEISSMRVELDQVLQGMGSAANAAAEDVALGSS